MDPLKKAANVAPASTNEQAIATITVKNNATETAPAKADTSPALAPAQPPAPTAANVSKRSSRDNDWYELKVKKEFIVPERPTSLGTLPEPTRTEESNEERGNNNGKGRKGNRSKNRRKGQNKKRPRDARPPDNEKLCLFIVQGGECPHGAESCKFSHDVATYLRTKQDDLEGIEGGCPGYRLQGFCKYGLCCRFAGSHTTKDGKNLTNESLVEKSPPILNIMDRALLTQLRKNQFPFICKRHFENNALKKAATAASTAALTGPDDAVAAPGGSEPAVTTVTTTSERAPTLNTANHLFSAPIPSKERKLIDFQNKIYIAPLTTVGNLPFRRIMKDFQADITCGEMAVATNLLEGKPSEWSLVKRHPSEDIFGIQLAAGHADQFTRCCEVLEKHVSMDFVDLNLGCPLDLICNKGGGAQMMLREKRLKDSLIGICNTISVPITVKMRTGWDESKPIAHNLVSKMQTWGIEGVATVFIHGRSRLQRYSKTANWDFISQVAMNQSDDLPKIPIVGNGDIFSYSDYEEKVAREGVNTTAMLARGALIKPWLPTEIKEQRHWDISATERLDILKNFCKFGLEHWGSDQQGVNTTRRFLLEWLSFLCRYTPVGLLERIPQQLNQRPPNHMVGRNDLETLFMSTCAFDWIKISEMLLGPVPEGFDFEPKHKASSYRK